MKTIFITGIGTDVGKTIASAIVTEALQADYWKPIQAGFDTGTDGQTVASLLSNNKTRIHPEVYKLALPASPHISARVEDVVIDIHKIMEAHAAIRPDNEWLVVEGAGGLMVPLSENAFVADIIKAINARTVLVSRNYLGSINHSLLTAMATRNMGLDVAGWIFNDQYMDYEAEIAHWSGYPKICSIPFIQDPTPASIKEQALRVRDALKLAL